MLCSAGCGRTCPARIGLHGATAGDAVLGRQAPHGRPRAKLSRTMHAVQRWAGRRRPLAACSAASIAHQLAASMSPRIQAGAPRTGCCGSCPGAPHGHHPSGYHSEERPGARVPGRARAHAGARFWESVVRALVRVRARAACSSGRGAWLTCGCRLPRADALRLGGVVQVTLPACRGTLDSISSLCMGHSAVRAPITRAQHPAVQHGDLPPSGLRLHGEGMAHEAPKCVVLAHTSRACRPAGIRREELHLQRQMLDKNAENDQVFEDTVVAQLRMAILYSLVDVSSSKPGFQQSSWRDGKRWKFGL